MIRIRDALGTSHLHIDLLQLLQHKQSLYLQRTAPILHFHKIAAALVGITLDQFEGWDVFELDDGLEAVLGHAHFESPFKHLQQHSRSEGWVLPQIVA